MAKENFGNSQLNSSTINDGYKYQNGDGLQPSAINKIIEAILYLQSNLNGGNASNITIDEELSITSENAVQNKVVTNAINNLRNQLSNFYTEEEINNLLSQKANKNEIPVIPTKVSEFENDSNYTNIDYVKSLVANALYLGENSETISSTNNTFLNNIKIAGLYYFKLIKSGSITRTCILVVHTYEDGTTIQCVIDLTDDDGYKIIYRYYSFSTGWVVETNQIITDYELEEKINTAKRDLTFNRLTQSDTYSPTKSTSVATDTAINLGITINNWSTYVGNITFADDNERSVTSTVIMQYRDKNSGYYLSTPFMYYDGTDWCHCVLFAWAHDRAKIELRNVIQMSETKTYASGTTIQFKELERGVY